MGSFRSAIGVVDGGERALNVGICLTDVGVCLAVVGDGGGPFKKSKKYLKFSVFTN